MARVVRSERGIIVERGRTAKRFDEIWSLEAIKVSGDFSTADRAAGDDAWRRWLTEVPGIASLLPALASKFRLLTELESDFGTKLQTAKLDALKEFAYGAGHELNNPLANIASLAQTLLHEETHPERRRRLAAINTQAFRAHEMLADLMLFARPPQIILAKVDVVRIAGEVLSELAADADAQQTTLRYAGAKETVLVDADPVQLRVALKALVTNSLEALGRGGNVTLDVRRRDSVAEIIVADDGPGIPPNSARKSSIPFSPAVKLAAVLASVYRNAGELSRCMADKWWWNV